MHAKKKMKEELELMEAAKDDYAYYDPKSGKFLHMQHTYDSKRAKKDAAEYYYKQ